MIDLAAHLVRVPPDISTVDLMSESLADECLWPTEIQDTDIMSIPEHAVVFSVSSNTDLRLADKDAADLNDDHLVQAGNTTLGDEITKQLSTRCGRFHITEDLRAGYFGATSNFHILYCGPDALVTTQYSDHESLW